MTDIAAPDLGSGPPATRLRSLARQVAACRACPLYEHATQSVFGEGDAHAALMLLGEEPGDREDRQGHPFVGPAGHLLDRALAEAGIDRSAVYLSNVVKHFKWSPSGKVRLHKKPNAREIRACRPWWEAEVAVVRPRVLCCLGATAAQAVLGSSFRVTRDRGAFFDLPTLSNGVPVPDVSVVATIHPAAVLRARDNDREQAMSGFVADLTRVASHLAAA
jgi:uracil-DNA glycosylase